MEFAVWNRVVNAPLVALVYLNRGFSCPGARVWQDGSRRFESSPSSSPWVEWASSRQHGLNLRERPEGTWDTQTTVLSREAATVMSPARRFLDMGVSDEEPGEEGKGMESMDRVAGGWGSAEHDECRGLRPAHQRSLLQQ